MYQKKGEKETSTRSLQTVGETRYIGRNLHIYLNIILMYYLYMGRNTS